MKSFFEEQGGTYTQVGDFLIPDLVLEEQPDGWIGKFGIMRQEYLKKLLEKHLDLQLTNFQLKQNLS